MALVQRLSTDRQLAARYSGVFVPLKITTSGQEWGKWVRKHDQGGNAIPMVYIIRADGKKMYSDAGSLPGPKLVAMLQDVVPKCGVILNDSQLAMVAKANEDLDAAAEDTVASMKLIEKLKKERMVSDADCYADSYNDLQTKIKAFTELHFDGTVDGSITALRLQQAMIRSGNRSRGLRNYVKALGEKPNQKMVAFGSDLVRATDVKWVSDAGDEVAGSLVDFEADGGVPTKITLKKVSGKTMGPLPLARFDADSRQLANAMYGLIKLKVEEAESGEENK